MTLLEAGFTLVPLMTVAALGAVVGRHGGRRLAARFLVAASVWSAATYGLAAAGLLDDFSLPPRILGVFVAGMILVAIAASSAVGRALQAAPWTVLFALQSVRVVVELQLHEAVAQGIAPPQMSWGGYNFDMASGASAVALALLAPRLPRAVIFGWNVAAAGLLGVVVVVAVLSMPTSMQRLHPDNTWIVHAPWVWLPAVSVSVAVLLHVVAFRKLLNRRA